MSEKILFVDDELNILHSIRRQLRKNFNMETALGGEEGLVKIEQNGPFAVVVSDFRMPGLNGVQFLAKVRNVAPDTVRMILTGYADVTTTITAVNEGNVFRFLTKPCPTEKLLTALSAGLHQYQLITAEKELLEKTLKGSVKILTEIMALVNPEAFGRSARIQRLVKNIAEEMHLPDIWELETAAMLSQIGYIILSETTMKKIKSGQPLTREEMKLIDKHASVAANLLSNIPRMKKIADAIAYQDKHYDGSGSPPDSVKEKAIPVGARLLKVTLDFDRLESGGWFNDEALQILENRNGVYDLSILHLLKRIVLAKKTDQHVKSVKLAQLTPNMIFEEDVKSDRGVLLISRGQEAGVIMIERLKNYAKTSGIKQPILVSVAAGK
ncbi:MAG TPA: response regulator [Bacteroidetes bacterium]|nr:response regulator [Bacteroidota bacterium]